MTGPASLPGVHPRLNAQHIRLRLDALARQAGELVVQVDAGTLRFASPCERDLCRDAVARLADVLLGLARKLEDAASQGAAA